MASTMYWLDVDADRTGVDVLVNGVSAEHLMGTHGIKLPINEYLVAGANWIEVRRSLWPSNRADAEGGAIRLTLHRETFFGTAQTAAETLVEQRLPYEQAMPRMTLARATFANVDAANLSFGDLEPIGDRERGMMLDWLAGVAAMWAAGNGDGLAAAMEPYLADYIRAYPLESLPRMKDSVRAMATEFARGTVRFDRQQTLLQPLGDGRLVDCLSRGGAAVRVERPKAPAYDMWTVLGVRGGRVQLVR